MSAENNFSIERQGIPLALTNVNQALALFSASFDKNMVVGASDVLIHNPGPLTVVIQAGDENTVALAPGDSASAVSMIVPPSTQTYGKGRTTHLAGKAIGGNQTIYAYVGNGA